MSAANVIEPQVAHDCRAELPWRSGGYGSTGHPDSTRAQCSCGRWWVSRPCYESYGPVTHWRPLRWYHRRSA